MIALKNKEERHGGSIVTKRLALLIAVLALGLTVSACGSVDGDAPSSAKIGAHPKCATELTKLRVSDVANVVGCGDEVILREKDLNAAYPQFNWSEDSGRVNEPIGSVDVVDHGDCGPPSASLDVIGAQVVELIGFFPGGDSTLWQDVVVLNNASDAERVFRSQLALIQCGESVERISPDGDFGLSLLPPIEVLEETGTYAVVSDEFEGNVLVFMHGGQYYSQLWLDPSWVENGMADRFIAMASSRLRHASG